MLGQIEGRKRRWWGGWDGWMASLTQWTWVWAGSESWWWKGKQSMGSQRVRHDWVTELSWTDPLIGFSSFDIVYFFWMLFLKKTLEQRIETYEYTLRTVGGNVNVYTTTTKNSMKFLQKIKNRTAAWSNNPICGCTTKAQKISSPKRYLYPHVHCSLFTIVKMWKPPKFPSMDEWIKKMWNKHTHNETVFRYAKEKHCHLWQHGWTLTALCQAKWIRQSQILYDIT